MRKRPIRTKVKLNHRITWGWRFLVLVCGLIVAGFFVREWRTSTWIGIEPYRWILWREGDNRLTEVIVISFIPEFQKMVIYQLPQDVYVPTREHGLYQVEALTRLGSITGKGEKVVLETMGRTFGLQLDEVMSTQHALEPGVINQVLQRELWTALTNETNAYDLIRLWWQLRQIPTADYQWIDLDQLHVYYESLDVDGNQRREVYTPLLDDIQFRTMPPAHEVFFVNQVVVVNGAGETGLAHELSRILNQEGFDLIRVENAEQVSEKSRILYGDELYNTEVTLKHLAQVTGITDAAQTGITDDYRADIVVMLGKDASGRY